jgi:hypothetical protein
MTKYTLLGLGLPNNGRWGISVKAILTLFMFIIGQQAWSQSFDLDQGENGGKPSSKPISAISIQSPVHWVNSNLGGTNAHYMEGFSVSYRAKLSGLQVGANYVIRIGFDVRQGSKYALDYITGVRNYFDHTFFGHMITEGEQADPRANPAFAGVAGNAAVTTFNLPAPNYGNAGQQTILQTSFNGLNTADKRQLTAYNATITAASYQTLSGVNLAAASTAEGVLLVRFTANAASAILAWGGHIASQLDWGLGNSASDISGSPYHMRIKGFGLDNAGHTNDQVANGGNTDRSLKTDAVVFCAVTGGEINNAQTVCDGDATGAFTNVVSGAGNGTISQQWQVSTTSCTEGFANITGATALTFDPPDDLAPGTYYYRRVTTSTGQLTCSANSNCVTLVVSAIPSAPDVTYNAPACDEATFSVTINSPVVGATYTIKDKNGDAIAGVLPSSSVVYASGSLVFSNIPAGSGFQVTVTINSCTSDPASCGASAKTVTAAAQKISTYSIQLTEETKVIAAPNPYSDKIRFSIQSAVSGKGSLELYNMLGQKVKTVYQGNFEQGKVQTIEYSVPGFQRANLIYLFRIGDQKTTGKLIGLK